MGDPVVSVCGRSWCCGEGVPGATTLLRFRRPLEEGSLQEAMLSLVNARLERAGLLMRGGSIVDASIIQAPSGTKNAKGERDPEMHQTKKGGQYYFGIKLCGFSCTRA